MANSTLLFGVILVIMAGVLTRGDLFAFDDESYHEDFDDVDENGDGFLTPQELSDGLNIDLVLANGYVVAEDDDGDGELNREEYEDLITPD